MYRVHGVVNLCIANVSFKMYSESDDHIVNEIFYNADYEKSEFCLIKELTKESKYFIDIGANTGIFTVFAGKANTELYVLSVEPHPANFKRLLTNISLNRLKNTRLFQNALGSTIKDLEFIVPSDLRISTTASANGGYAKNFHHAPHMSIMVKQQTIDELCATLPITHFDVIKLDVEYYELEVLQGAYSTLVNKRPMIIIEILQYERLIQQFPEMEGKIDKNHATDIFNFFQELGYHGYSIESNELNYVSNFNAQKNRNFLFLSERLSKNIISYSEIKYELSRVSAK